ncbi:hypothetical protein ACNOYE_27620 [Nannocystaceae bacterium ST9]
MLALGCTDDATDGTDEVGETGTGTATDSTGDGDGDGDTVDSSSDTTSADTTDTSDSVTTSPDTTDTTDATDTTSGDSCSDGSINQDETDIDCGGSTCGPCADGSMCLAPTDCTSTNCVDGLCAPLGCQADEDCNALDGACSDGTCDLQTNECVATPINEGNDCDSGDLCLVGGVCTAGSCAATPVDCTGLDDACNLGTCNPMDGSCVAEPANEGLDCGGLCAPGALCSAGACMGGEPVDCTALDDECNLGTCDPMDGSCVAAPANEGVACNDGEACTITDVCTAGTCTDPDNPDGYLFAETFANNNAVWTLGTNWAIGSAVAGCGDPALDHTPTNDNGIAGVVLGGCAPTTVNANFFCLTSPAVDTSALPTVFVNYWRDLWSDYTPYMKNKIEVWNGNAWVIVYETFGAPEVNDAAWGNFSYDVTAHKNAAMQVRWCYNVAAAGAFQRGQWNVDDVTIGQVSCTATP